MQTNWTNADSKRDAARAKQQANLASKIATKEQKAKNPATQAAINAFNATVTSLMQTRKNAVDAAVTAYRNGITQIINARQSALTNSSTTYDTAVNTALNQAQTDCAGGTDPKTVKNNFTAAKKAAMQALRASQISLGSTADEITPLVTVRNQAILAAQTDFKNGLATAQAILKAAVQAN